MFQQAWWRSCPESERCGRRYLTTTTKARARERDIIRWATARRGWFFCDRASARHNPRAEVLRQQGVAVAESRDGRDAGRRARWRWQTQAAGCLRALTNANVLIIGFDYPDIDLDFMMPDQSASPEWQAVSTWPGEPPITAWKRISLAWWPRMVNHGRAAAQEGRATSSKPPLRQPGEPCAIAVSIRSASGPPIPEPERQKLELRDDDIMGLEGKDLEVSS